MARITWPSYTIPAEPAPVSVPLDIQSASIQIEYPGRRTVKAQFSNKELVYDVSEGEWRGSVQIAGQNRNSSGHLSAINFLSEMNDNPGENWTELPWEKPSIYTLNSTFTDRSAIHGNNNEEVARTVRVTGGVVRINAIATFPGENIVISAGEHFGLGQKTYRIVTATAVAGSPGQWDVQTAPSIMTNSTTAMPIFKRNFLPCRIVGGQDIGDPTNGRFAGPWGFTIVEYATD